MKIKIYRLAPSSKQCAAVKANLSLIITPVHSPSSWLFNSSWSNEISVQSFRFLKSPQAMINQKNYESSDNIFYFSRKLTMINLGIKIGVLPSIDNLNFLIESWNKLFF